MYNDTYNSNFITIQDRILVFNSEKYAPFEIHFQSYVSPAVKKVNDFWNFLSLISI